MFPSPRTTISCILSSLLILALSVPALAGEESADAETSGQTSASEAFERLKALDGTWRGTAGPQGGEMNETAQNFRVSSAGTVVMETMFPDTEHEMINMYHLDGDDLVVTHYCASGNQPTMKLAEISEDGRTFHFQFTGGTNLDPSVDGHIHEGTVTILDGDTVRESWTGYSGGKPHHSMIFELERSE